MSNFVKIHLVGAMRTDGRDKYNSRLSQFCERVRSSHPTAYKAQILQVQSVKRSFEKKPLPFADPHDANIYTVWTKCRYF